MIRSKDSEDDFTIPTYSRCSASNVVSNNRSVMPITPFMGVRISWLILAKKSDLARLAASADSLALRNSSDVFLASASM